MVRFKNPPPVPYEVMEVAQIYSLIQIGLSYKEANEIPNTMADYLLEFHKQIKEYEADKLEQQTKKYK